MVNAFIHYIEVSKEAYLKKFYTESSGYRELKLGITREDVVAWFMAQSPEVIDSGTANSVTVTPAADKAVCIMGAGADNCVTAAKTYVTNLLLNGKLYSAILGGHTIYLTQGQAETDFLSIPDIRGFVLLAPYTATCTATENGV